MKKIFIYTILFLFSINLSFSVNEVIIKGKIANSEADRIYIRNIKHYKDYFGFEKVYIASAPVDVNGNFEIKFELTRAIPLEINYGNEIQEIYLEPGNNLTLSVNNKKFSESMKFEGGGAEINNFLVKFSLKFENEKELEKLNKNIRSLSSFEFIEYNLKRRKEQQDFYDSYFQLSIPIAFKSYVTANIAYEWAGVFLKYFNYALLHNIPIDTSKYSVINDVDLMNDKAISSGKYLAFLELYSQFFYLLDCKEHIRKGEEIDTVKEYYEIYKVVNEKYTGEIQDLMLSKSIALAIQSPNLKQFTQWVDKMLRHYKKINKNKVYFKLLLAQYRLVNKLAPGNPAPNFTYPDLNGKNVSLSDFKGKVVYIDIWASWCSKCRTEFSHCQKLEEQFKNKDVVFIKVSIDRSDKLWQKVINDKKIGGVNVFTGKHFESEIVKDYNIQGIPHYIIIDKNGTIVENKAKRPSQGVEKDIEMLLGRSSK